MQGRCDPPSLQSTLLAWVTQLVHGIILSRLSPDVVHGFLAQCHVVVLRPCQLLRKGAELHHTHHTQGQACATSAQSVSYHVKETINIYIPSHDATPAKQNSTPPPCLP